LAITLTASAFTFAEAGMPLALVAPLALKLMVAPPATARLLTTVAGGTGTNLDPVTVEAALV